MTVQREGVSPNDFLCELADVIAEWEMAHETVPLVVPVINNMQHTSPWIIIASPEAQEQEDKVAEKSKPK